jgi:hypothetical protein
MVGRAVLLPSPSGIGGGGSAPSPTRRPSRMSMPANSRWMIRGPGLTDPLRQRHDTDAATLEAVAKLGQVEHILNAEHPA